MQGIFCYVVTLWITLTLSKGNHYPDSHSTSACWLFCVLRRTIKSRLLRLGLLALNTDSRVTCTALCSSSLSSCTAEGHLGRFQSYTINNANVKMTMHFTWPYTWVRKHNNCRIRKYRLTVGKVVHYWRATVSPGSWIFGQHLVIFFFPLLFNSSERSHSGLSWFYFAKVSTHFNGIWLYLSIKFLLKPLGFFSL